MLTPYFVSIFAVFKNEIGNTVITKFEIKIKQAKLPQCPGSLNKKNTTSKHEIYQKSIKLHRICFLFFYS